MTREEEVRACTCNECDVSAAEESAESDFASPRAADDALHTPVMLTECIDLLAPALEAPGALLIDATVGMGGHTFAFLSHFPHLRVIGIDRDEQALALASERLSSFGERFEAVYATYDMIADVAARLGKNGKVDAILMDLGVSSLQLDEAERGFAYSHDAPLDMRMDTSSGITAAELLATEGAQEITRILQCYGEERFAQRIAQKIVAQREREPLTRTSQLVELVRKAIPAATRRTGGHPAKRTFQALRIAVNDELAVLERAIPEAMRVLRLGGRLAVESYHSLEDKIVKAAFVAGASSTAPEGLPFDVPGYEPEFQLLTRGALQAPPEERERNSRSASVRLRAIERIREEMSKA